MGKSFCISKNVSCSFTREKYSCSENYPLKKKKLNKKLTRNNISKQDNVSKICRKQL